MASLAVQVRREVNFNVKVVRKIAVLAVAGAAAATIAACGSSYSEAHDHNAPAPSQDTTPAWVRIDSPGSYETIIHGCFNGDGIFETQDSTSLRIIPRDPACAAGN